MLKFVFLILKYIHILTETWLSKNISSSELGFNNNNVYRCDHNLNTSSRSRGGGVLITINDSLHAKLLSSLEIIFIKLGYKLSINSFIYFPIEFFL